MQNHETRPSSSDKAIAILLLITALVGLGLMISTMVVLVNGTSPRRPEHDFGYIVAGAGMVVLATMFEWLIFAYPKWEAKRQQEMQARQIKKE